MHIVLFLTYGNSFRTWKTAGILERELALYKAHIDNGIQLTVISYGKTADETNLIQNVNCEVRYNRWKLPTPIYGLLVPVLHFKTFIGADILKSNQMYGAHIISRVSKIFHKPWILRQGYSFADHTTRSFGRTSTKAINAERYEKRYLKEATRLIFSAEELAQIASKKYLLPECKYKVVPNYILTEFWSPQYQARPMFEPYKGVFFGRFVGQKNLQSLIKSCEGLNVELYLIGDGLQAGELADLSVDCGVACHFTGRLEQNAVKSILSNADFFVLPSFYEGHPKALIESMCFGIPVLAADSPGINSIVIDGETGILVAPTVDGLRSGIIKFSNLDENERRRLGMAARNWVVERFSLSNAVSLESEVIQSIHSRS